MNITFFIGNGFDLHQGLETGYEDFYKNCLLARKGATDNFLIQRILEEEQDGLWADLELELGATLKKLENGERKRLGGDLVELIKILLAYLEAEEERFVLEGSERAIAEEMCRSLTGLGGLLTPKDRKLFDELKHRHQNDEFKYCFVNFNYTGVLHEILRAVKSQKKVVGTHPAPGGHRNETLGQLVHVHGNLDRGAVLGVNDPSQIGDPALRDDEEVLNLLIKERIDDNQGDLNVDSAQGIIDKSLVICIYGMSFGATDKMWWERIVQWLQVDADRLLFLCTHEDAGSLERQVPQEIHALKQQRMERFLAASGIELDDSKLSELCGRIFVLLEPDMFNFGKYTAPKGGDAGKS